MQENVAQDEDQAELEVLRWHRFHIDSIAEQDGCIEARGWALSEAPISSASFRVNGEIPLHFEIVRQGIENAFPGIPVENQSRFRIRSPLRPSDRSVEIQFQREEDDGHISKENVWCWPIAEALPLPETENVSRVIVGSIDAYKLGGLTTVRRLDASLSRVTGRGLANIGRILDWGCGCLRVSRYIKSDFTDAIEGCDIDAKNVAWCRNNAKSIPVQLAPLVPPLAYGDNRFDLIIGVSVVTHLRERIQDLWLNELARVTKPGGIIALSIMGPATQYIAGYPLPIRARVAHEGFVVVDEQNRQIPAELDGSAYYINVLHSHDYIRRHWPAVAPVRVVEILPALAAGQDVVFLRNEK